MNKNIIRSKSPLRLGLAGGGTDVSPYSDIYGGAILNATINMYTYTTVKPLSEQKIIFEALDLKERLEFPLAAEIPAEGKLILHKGIYNRVVRDFNGGQPMALHVITHSDAPAGSGLGSSSTLAVSILRAFQELLNIPLGEYELAHLAYEIERMDLKMSGGKQDQYAAAFGGFNFMEFYKDDKVIVNPLRIKRSFVNELNYNLMLYFTGTSRSSSDIIQRQVKNVQSQDAKSIEAMHKLKEQAVIMKEAVLKGEIGKFGEILNYGWEHKKAMTTGITNTEINEIYDTAIQCGASGGKVSGAGGGGFMMLFCDGNKRFQVIDGLKKFSGHFVDFQFSADGVESWRI